MRGDILFYQGGPGFLDRLIQWRTHGPYVHVEVDLGDGTAIGARLRTGVTRHPLISTDTVHRLATTPDHLEAGITWLLGHLGDPYGWADILDQALTLVSPKGLILGQQHGFDCSDLVARYVDVAGGLDLGTLLDTPSLISPNDLARACGLLKG